MCVKKKARLKRKITIFDVSEVIVIGGGEIFSEIVIDAWEDVKHIVGD